MAYNAAGDYYPGDEEPSLDQMRMELGQKQSPAVSQIPTQGYPKAPALTPTRPLDHVPETFKKLVNNYNPLMMHLMMRDVGKIGANMVSPFVGAYAGMLSNTQAKGAELMHGAMGNEAAAQEARDRMVRPDAPEQAAKFYQQPQTPAMQNVEEGLGTAFDALHLPAAGPGSGMPGHMPLSPRPMLTPNDVRVMGAEATRMGRQVRDIPTDFANAQSGFKRIDPITNEPTYGAKLGSAERGLTEIGMKAEKALDPIVTDILEKGGTSADLLAAMAGTPMHAVRPKGSRLISPTRTSTDPNYRYPKDSAGSILRSEFAKPYSTEVEPTELLGIAEKYKTISDGDPQTERAFDNYFNARMQEMFPDAPDAWNARDAFDFKYADPESKARMQLVILNDFLTQTPEGQASGMPVPAELEKRHLAAMKWLTGPYTNYIERNVGTEGDPLVKLASEGLTMLPSTEIENLSRYNIDDAKKHRIKGGYPVGGSFEKVIDNKERELRNARDELRELETRRSELATAARTQGLENPAQLPEYAALTNPIRAKAAARDKLQKALENLQLGSMYEDVTDAVVVPRIAKSAQEMDYPHRQFYPTLMQTPADALVYQSSRNLLHESGLSDIASKFYDAVMSGKIPLDKVEKTTVENFVRETAKERIKLETEKKAKEAQYIATAENRLKAVLQNDVPNSMTFGNVGVVELTKDTPVDVATARVSEDTAILDHCVGQGGSAASNKINPFTGKRQSYEPIIDPVTGQPNPNAGSTSTSYIRGLYEDNQLASIRSLETGRPVATLQFNKSHLGTNGQQRYNIGYASGFQNGEVDPAYAPAIRDYLNSRADSIAGTGDNLRNHTGVYDVTDPDDVRWLAKKTQLTKDQINEVLIAGMPRFVLPEDITKAYSEGTVAITSAPANTVASPFDNLIIRTEDIPELRTSMSQMLDNAATTAAESFDNDRAGDVLRTLVQQRVAGHLDSFHAQDLHDALINLRDALNEDESMYVNAHSELSNAVGEGIGEYLTDLNGIINYYERQANDRAAVAPAPAEQNANFNFADLFEPEPNHPANLPAPMQALRIDFPGILDSIVNEAAQFSGVQNSERIDTIAHRVAENVNPRIDPEGYAVAVREAADAQPSHIVELALYDLADRIETNVAQQRQQFLYQPTSQRYANELLEMGRNADGTINRADLLSTAHALSNGQLDHPAFTHIPPGPERAEAMAPVLEHFNRLVANEYQRLAPAPVANDLTQMPRGELVEHVEPGRWNMLNERADRATILARQLPHPDVFATEIREGTMQDLTNGLNMFEREIVAREMLDALQFIDNALQAPAPAEQPANIADRFLIPTDVRNASTPALANHLTPADEGAVTALSETLTSVNDREDLPRIVHLIRNHRIGEWEGFDDAQREILARLVQEHYDQAPRQVQMPAPGSVADLHLRAEAGQVASILNDAYFNEAEDTNPAGAAPMIRSYIANMDATALEALLGMSADTFEITPQLVEAVRQELQNYLAHYGGEGHANGGLVRGYQSGGSVQKDDVPTPGLFSVSDYARAISKDMYPGQYGTDDQRDAARHMLAAGTLSRKYGPTAAEFLGKAHEFTTSPLQAVKHMFGGQMPPDYNMDTHNNALGAQLGQRAKTQAELEDLVQNAAERASYKQIPGQAFIRKANGGTVARMPNLDEIQYQLMMRRK